MEFNTRQFFFKSNCDITTFVTTAKTIFAAFIRRQRWKLLIIALLLIDIILAVIYGLTYSINVPTFHLDGAYQTASGLYRLANGQWPGKDFYPYLGLGLIYFLYPIFLLAGGKITASLFTAYFTTACSVLLSVGLITGLLAKSHKLLVGALIGSLVLAYCIYLHPRLPEFLLEHLTPGYSLRPLRAILPYLCAVLIYPFLKSKRNPLCIYSCLGGLAGAACLWTNDFGIPTAGLLIFFSFQWAYQTGALTFKVAIAIIFAALLTAFLLLMLSTDGHSINLLRYNFIDIRIDQYWYFVTNGYSKSF